MEEGGRSQLNMPTHNTRMEKCGSFEVPATPEADTGRRSPENDLLMSWDRKKDTIVLASSRGLQAGCWLLGAIAASELLKSYR